jgi:hypothetical protein
VHDLTSRQDAKRVLSIAYKNTLAVKWRVQKDVHLLSTLYTATNNFFKINNNNKGTIRWQT